MEPNWWKPSGLGDLPEGSGQYAEAWLRRALRRACAEPVPARRRRLLPLLDRVLHRACGNFGARRLAGMFSYVPSPQTLAAPPATFTLSLDPATREEESGLLEVHRSLLISGTEQGLTRFVILAGHVELDDRWLPLQQTVGLQPMDRCVVQGGSRLLFPRAAASRLLVAALLAGFTVLPRIGTRGRCETASLISLAYR